MLQGPMFLLQKLGRTSSFALLRIAGSRFANPAFSPRLLAKHVFMQKILGINGHVPFPVHPSSVITAVANIDPGTRCPGLSPGCYIQGNCGIFIGRNVWIGPNVGVISANHAIENYSEHRCKRPIRIGDNCWIGMNAVILPGVELGEHVIVGAGAVVTKSFGSNCIIGGNPARVIKRIGTYSGFDSGEARFDG